MFLYQVAKKMPKRQIPGLLVINLWDTAGEKSV